MNELTPLPQLVAEIKVFLCQSASGMIEAGRRLIEAKKQLEHGQWGNFLQENFKLSQERARQFMRVAEEFGNSNTCWNLNPSQVIALLDVPAADRESFLATTHEVNGQQKTVDEMTSRELAATIKAMKEKDAEIQRQSQKLQKLEEDLEQSKVAQKMLADLKKPDTVTVEKRVEVIPPDYEATKQKLKEATAKIDKLTDEQLGQAQAIFQQGKRAEIRSRLSMLAKDVGKHVTELKLLVRILPGDESVASDLTEIANILRDTADAVEEMESGVTIDAGFDTNVWPG